MSNREMKTEVLRLVNTIHADRMEDLLFTIRAFTEQQEMGTDMDINSPELLEKLNQSLKELEAGQFISNDDVIAETKKWLSR